jgi:hypothetical protein
MATPERLLTTRLNRIGSAYRVLYVFMVRSSVGSVLEVEVSPGFERRLSGSSRSELQCQRLQKLEIKKTHYFLDSENAFNRN